MPFACSYVTKDVTEDDFDEGCLDERRCVMADKVDITGETIVELLANISQHLGINVEIDDVFIPDPDVEQVPYIDWNRAETDSGDEPTPRETELWKQGKMKMWLADYSFLITHRVTRPVTMKEILDSGIKTH